MNVVRRYVNKIREKLRIKAMFNAAIDVPLPITVNFRPECAMIGDAMLCTHLQDVSLLRLDAASSRIVSLNSVLPKGNYKLAACKSQGVFFVADPCHVMAIDPNGNVLSKKRIIEQNGRIVQKVQSLACDELSNKVSVIQTDDLNYEMVSLLEWTGAAFNVIGGLNMDEVDYDAQVIIDPLRHPLNIMNEYQSPSPSTVQLLSPLHFTAWVSDESEDEVCKLFKIDEPDMKKKGRQTLTARPLKTVNLSPQFSCFTQLEPQFEVCACLEYDMAHRMHPPTLEFFSDLTIPITQIPLRDRSVALCSGNEAHQFCLCRVVGDEPSLAVDMFKYHPALPEVSRSSALPTTVSLDLVDNPSAVHHHSIDPSNIVRSDLLAMGKTDMMMRPKSKKGDPKQGGSKSKRKFTKSKKTRRRVRYNK
jgi:hypothetical protein